MGQPATTFWSFATGAAPNAIRTPISCTLCPIDRGQGLLLAALGGLVSIAQACMKLHEG